AFAAFSVSSAFWSVYAFAADSVAASCWSTYAWSSGVSASAPLDSKTKHIEATARAPKLREAWRSRASDPIQKYPSEAKRLTLLVTKWDPPRRDVRWT